MTLFAVLLFALLPLMALIIHTGFITLTRRQMQTVVNTAAKEGLRSELSSGPSRVEVSTLASLVFDDDLHLEATEQDELDSREMVLGAGPSLTLSEGIKLGDSTFHASREITGLNDKIYPSGLETNTGDEVDGDMLAGQYDPDGSHVEPSSYVRQDFLLDGDAGWSANDAFLVRLRRSNEVPEDGVSSYGDPVPFLFGRTPYGNADGGTSLLDQKERGTIVRAAAIARLQPVITVGVPSPDVNEGLAIFEIYADEWNDPMLMTGAPVPVTLQANGDISGDLAGRFIDRELMMLGDLTQPSNSIPVDLEVDAVRVAAITVIDGTDRRVVAFGMVVLEVSMGDYFITKLTATDNVPFFNTSPAFLKSLSVSGSDFTDVWNTFVSTDERAMAGALVRSIR
jgi:hypothetical protein